MALVGASAHALAFRPPRLTDISALTEAGDGELCLAVDVGGTKMAVGLCDRDGVVLWRGRAATPGTTDAEVLFQVLSDLVEAAVDEATPRRLVACGVGCGGPMTQDGETVSPLNIPAWRSFPLRDRLVALLQALCGPDAPFPRVDNDAKALALGEGWRGAAKGERNYLAMVVSTGVGGGIVLDGRLLHGATGNAGHIGHVIVEPGGAVCGCGARGCLEAEASGTGIVRTTGRPPEEATPAVVERTGRLVGRGIGSVANLLDLRLAVVGGSVALGFGPPFFRAAQAEVDVVARLSFSHGCRVERPGLAEDAPLIGAAALGWGVASAGHDS